jgi:hypothetical protein
VSDDYSDACERGEAMEMAWDSIDELTTERDQLRVSLEACQEQLREALDELVEARESGDQLRTALRELVEALPECSERWWKTHPERPLTESGRVSCHARGTWVHIGPDGDESYYCDAHKERAHEEATWASAFRNALALLEAKEGGR